MNEFSYLILVEVPAKGPMEELVKALQAAYDEGAAGQFEVVVTREPGYMVTFLRSTSEDDMDYLRARMKKDNLTVQDAAKQQLGEELHPGIGSAALPVVQDLLNFDAQIIDFAGALTRDDESV